MAAGPLVQGSQEEEISSHLIRGSISERDRLYSGLIYSYSGLLRTQPTHPSTHPCPCCNLRGLQRCEPCFLVAILHPRKPKPIRLSVWRAMSAWPSQLPLAKALLKHALLLRDALL